MTAVAGLEIGRVGGNVREQSLDLLKARVPSSEAEIPETAEADVDMAEIDLIE